MIGSKVGRITWVDLTVENAEVVRDFYQGVVGWTPEPVNMGEYQDFNMTIAGEPIVGVCHKRGDNAALPPTWLVYIQVDNLDTSLAACERLGGKLVTPVRGEKGNRFVIIQDPAGAICALFEHHEKPVG